MFTYCLCETRSDKELSLFGILLQLSVCSGASCLLLCWIAGDLLRFVPAFGPRVLAVARVTLQGTPYTEKGLSL